MRSRARVRARAKLQYRAISTVYNENRHSGELVLKMSNHIMTVVVSHNHTHAITKFKRYCTLGSQTCFVFTTILVNSNNSGLPYASPVLLHCRKPRALEVARGQARDVLGLRLPTRELAPFVGPGSALCN